MNLGGMGAIYLSHLLDEIDYGDIFEWIDKVEKQKKLQQENKPKPKDVELFYKELLERLLIIKS